MIREIKHKLSGCYAEETTIVWGPLTTETRAQDVMDYIDSREPDDFDGETVSDLQNQIDCKDERIAELEKQNGEFEERINELEADLECAEEKAGYAVEEALAKAEEMRDTMAKEGWQRDLQAELATLRAENTVLRGFLREIERYAGNAKTKAWARTLANAAYERIALALKAAA